MLYHLLVPFAQAHDISGKAVRYCEGKGIELFDLTADDLPAIDASLTAEVLDVLTISGSINARDGRGGTAERQVAAQLDECITAMAGLDRWFQAWAPVRAR